MREWLLHSEWCDVRLLCRGRVFSAHRAVLASVSSYLRCILVSHAEHETPIYIVLPDFDWEAMSSVLYYVYNGEINIPVANLTSFFEIINTLKIFVDQGSLQNIKNRMNCLDTKFIDTSGYTEFISSDRENIEMTKILKEDSSTKSSDDLIKLELQPTSGSTKTINGKLNQYSTIQLFTHNQAEQSCQRRRHLPFLDNLQTRTGDKQKNSLLRDSPTETNPQNGNTQSVDVPTIPNEHYLELLSRAVMNGNDDVTATTHNSDAEPLPTETELSNSILVENVNYKQLDIHKSTNENHKSGTQIPLNLSFQNIKLLRNLLISKNANLENSNNRMSHRIKCLRPIPSLLPIGKYEYDLPLIFRHPHDLLDLSVKFASSKGNNIQTDKHEFLIANSNPIVIKECRKNTKTNLQNNRRGSNNLSENKNINMKRPPLNQVLASPWSPRLPNTYKPRYIQQQNLIKISDTDISNENAKPFNDKNNNIHETVIARSNEELVTVTESCKVDPILSSNKNASQIIDEVPKIGTDCESSSNDEVSGDMRKDLSKIRHTCDECGKSFSQLRNYKYHLSVHRGTREFAATCTICGKYFNDRGYLSSHMKIHRNRKEYQCLHCPKSFNQRVAYNMHIRIHTGVKPHVCGECGKAFSRKMLLKQHQRTHSGERPYACTFCDKRFADRSNMTLHMRLHSGVKPFSCTLCPKSFTKKHHLKTHLNYHTGAKPYSCPRCNLAFSQSSNMRTHLKKCTVSETTTT